MGSSYYSDQNIVSYDILNAVAMKYVTIFRCRDFFIDETIRKISSPFIKLYFTDEPNKTISQSDKSAFVKQQNSSKDKIISKPKRKSFTISNLFSVCSTSSDAFAAKPRLTVKNKKICKNLVLNLLLIIRNGFLSNRAAI